MLALLAYILTIALFVWRKLSSSERHDKGNSPVSFSDSWIFAIWPFFRNRFDFLNAGFRSTGQTLFKFKLLFVRCSSALLRLAP